MHSKKLYFFGLLCLCFFFNACYGQLKQSFLSMEDISFEEEIKIAKKIGMISKVPCRDPQSYIPDTSQLDQFPIRQIRVNFHFVNAQDSSKNYNGTAAVKFAKVALQTANQKVAVNNKPWLSVPVDLPGLPKRYQYVLTPRSSDPSDKGVYCHYDDQLYYFVNKGRNRNNSSRSDGNRL